LILSTHDRGFAKEFADYKILLNDEHEASVVKLCDE
jgi:ABC-type polar amino acid transport system ATPase subunit